MVNPLNPKSALYNWSLAMQERLSYEYNSSKSVLNHNSILGTIREGVVRDILTQFMPISVEVGSGQIINSLGELSNQTDIIIASGNTPAFRFEGGMTAFILETVLAIIEVKSMLYRDKLHEALDNTISVRSLTYILQVNGKGIRIFDEAFEFIQSRGGLDKVEDAILNPDFSKSLGCPTDVWGVIPFVRFWMHWELGNLRSPKTFENNLKDIASTASFDFFVHLLQFITRTEDSLVLLTERYNLAKEIRQGFFNKLYEYLLFEHLAPMSAILAYGGYESISNMASEVRTWLGTKKGEVAWFELPRVIMNHRMVMYRHFNQYHCVEFDRPVMFLINAICNTIAQDLMFSTSIGGVSSLTRYFNIDLILGEAHPKNSPSYAIWDIPIDNSSPGEIKRMKEIATTEKANVRKKRSRRK